MIQIYKNYEGHKELEELDHIELQSWVMTTHDPNLMELGDEVFELSDGIVI